MEYHGAVFELVKYQSYKSKTTYRVTGISKQTPLLEIPSTYKGNPVIQFSIDAFYGSEKPCFREVKKLFIPSGIEAVYFGNRTFPNLEELKIEPGNKDYSTDGRCLMNGDGTKLILALAAGMHEEPAVVPRTVKKIENHAFSGTLCREIVFENASVSAERDAFINSVWFQNQEDEVYVGNTFFRLKKTELLQTEMKISSCGDRIRSVKSKLDMLKPGAAANSLGGRDLEKYRKLKQSLYWQKNRLNRLKQRKAGLEYQIREKVYDMCYGSKEMFHKQHLLVENGYRTHEKWRNDFIRSRDGNIFYLGSSDESYGNQMCRLKYDPQTRSFTLELRKEYKYCMDSKACSKYIRLGGLDFKYRKDELSEILESYDTAGNGSRPLSYRFHRTGNRWYLQAIFEQSFTDYRTVSKYGTVGLDYNDGFIELSETDSSGNLTGRKHFTLKDHGTGKRAEAEIRDVIAEITGYAEKRCKDIVIEDLDFKRKKACQTARPGKKHRKYNRMLHLFDYHRYKQTLQNAGFNHRVNIIVVDPKNTSRIGKQKYCGSRKLNIHQAAAYVIARRGQGYNDRLIE